MHNEATQPSQERRLSPEEELRVLTFFELLMKIKNRQQTENNNSKETLHEA